MSDITRKQMVEWLKAKIERDIVVVFYWGQKTEWMRYIEGLNVDGESFSPGYAETKRGVEICQAILAALEGPSEEERKEMRSHVGPGCIQQEHTRYPEECKICDKIRALIQGDPALGKEAGKNVLP